MYVLYWYVADDHILHRKWKIYFITTVPTPKKILSDNENLYILYKKYVQKNPNSSEV